MKRINALLLTAVLFLVPTVGLADYTTDDFLEPAGDFAAPIPEPTAAVLMGVGLAIVGLALRQRR